MSSRLSRALRAANAPGDQRGAVLSNPPDWLSKALGQGGRTYSGKHVTVGTSLELAAFYRGVNILSNAFVTAPFVVYKGADEAKERARDSDPWELLHDQANDRMAASEYWGLVEYHVETWGNHFGWKERASGGQVGNLWPLDPARVAVGTLSDGRLRYIVDGNEGTPFTSREIFHVRGLSLDGVVGYSSVQLARQALGNEMSRQEFQGRFWKNDATPGVTLIHPQALKPDAVNRLRALWDDRHKGPGKARQTAVLGENVQVQQMTMPLQDAQFIEQGRYSRTEIALMLGLPPYMLAGDSGSDSLTYSTTEGYSLDLLKWTVGPRYVRVQDAVNLDEDLMPAGHRGEFLADALTRATQTERYRAWATAPHLTIDEMRAADNLAPLPNGEGEKLAKAASKPAAPQLPPPPGAVPPKPEDEPATVPGDEE